MEIKDLEKLLEIVKLLSGGETKKEACAAASMLGRHVIIRTYSAGCWFGELSEKSESEVVLKNPRYVLHPGWVLSKNDRQMHFVDARRLADLYRVDFRRCAVASDPGFRALAGDIDLYPDISGRYELPPVNELED